MQIKHLFSLLILSLTLTLTACVESVSNENETLYGRFSTSQLEQETADKLIRQAVEFNETSYGKAKFLDGYSVLNSNAGAYLYVGVYKYEEPGVSGVALQDWARALQESNKSGWTFVTTKSDKYGNQGSYGDNGETIYDTSEAFSVSGKKDPSAAVKVEYKLTEGTYWVYLALPSSMIKASVDEEIVDLFSKHRNSK